MNNKNIIFLYIRQGLCKNHVWHSCDIKPEDEAIDVTKKQKCFKCEKIRFKSLHKYFKWQYRTRN